MGREPIPEELRRFILTSVRSVPFVEAMLLFRAARSRPLGARELARRLYMPATFHSTCAVLLMRAYRETHGPLLLLFDLIREHE